MKRLLLIIALLVAGVARADGLPAEDNKPAADNKNGWTLTALKEYFERVVIEQQKYFERVVVENEKAVKAAFAAAEKAIEKSEAAQAAYNVRSNEFRAALDDQSKLMLPRTEADQRFQQLTKDMAELQQFKNLMAGQTASSDKWSETSKWVVGLVVTVLIVVAGYVFRPRPAK